MLVIKGLASLLLTASALTPIATCHDDDACWESGECAWPYSCCVEAGDCCLSSVSFWLLVYGSSAALVCVAVLGFCACCLNSLSRHIDALSDPPGPNPAYV